ncbi:hypothetical protein pb186bvf_012074 [Paramecium bursaria]
MSIQANLADLLNQKNILEFNQAGDLQEQMKQLKDLRSQIDNVLTNLAGQDQVVKKVKIQQDEDDEQEDL